jgi:hypothetical protein
VEKMANKGLLVPRDLKVQMEQLVERDQEDSEAIKVIYSYLLLNRR